MQSLIRWQYLLLLRRLTKHWITSQLKKTGFFCNFCKYISSSINILIDILILGCCNRFSVLIKLCSQVAEITITPINHIFSPPTGWTNWPVTKVHISKLNWRQIPLSIHPRKSYIHCYFKYTLDKIVFFIKSFKIWFSTVCEFF